MTTLPKFIDNLLPADAFMENQPEDTRLFRLNKIGANELKIYFVSQLNYIYCVKSHLQERLPELLEQANFIDLRQAIAETMDDVDRQIKRMDAMFILLEADYLIELSGGMVGMIDDAFNMINKQSHNVILRDLSMLFYLQNIESLEMASFQILELAAAKMKDKRIRQLLKENYDEARDDRALFVMITAKYLVN